ncbi:helix-turn-helix domain-containing protein [Treponema sp.]
MESLGEKLKAARERKACTFDQISRDTNIARRYLEALENEDFSQFPGEPYLLGFLRNYSDYLGLESQDLISLYKNLKIQEQPIPVEQLLGEPHRAPSKVLLAAAALVLIALLATGAFFVLGRPSSSSPSAATERKLVEYKLDSGFLEKRLYLGDSILVSLGGELFKVSLAKLGEQVSLSSPGGALNLELGQEGALDLNGDSQTDLKVFIADLFKNEPAKGVALRFELSSPALPQNTALDEGSGELAGVLVKSDIAGIAETPIPSATGSPILLSSPNPYPFTLQATFKGYCMFRWESDRKEREERYFHKAEILNVQSQNGIRLWISNASAVKLQVIGGGKTVDLELGGAGEIVVTDLKWVKDADGRFKLTTVRLD